MNTKTEILKLADQIEEYTRKGELLADVLLLRKDREGRYPTSRGNKTALGLFLTVKRIIKEE